MSYQLTIFDVLAPETPKEVPYGYIKNIGIVGKKLTFKDLKNYIGKQVIHTVQTESRCWWFVYKVIDYFEGCDKYYKRVRPLPDNNIGYGEIVNDFIHDVVGIKECMDCYELSFVCDRVALSSKGKNKADSFISEAWCTPLGFVDDEDVFDCFFEVAQNRRK